jgi:aryl-alcohol dehydrogenase-like predicted oxidoreductase
MTTGNMETLNIPSFAIKPSRICLGTWAMGGREWGGADEKESINTILKAFEKGINIIDTAPVYGFGVSEEIVGKALQAYGARENIIVATKVGLEWKEGKVFRNSSPVRLRKELEDSLKRLQTDYIDIYQIHWPDESVPFEETAKTLLDFQKQGKIKAIGVSNFSPSQMQAFRKTASIHTSQNPFNLFERAIEEETFPYSEKNGLYTLAYGSLCRGLLSGKMNENSSFKGDDLRNHDPKFQKPLFLEYFNAVEALKKFARENYNKSVLALSVRGVLDQGHTIALWGARHPNQLDDIDEVMGWKLDENAFTKIDSILSENIKHPVGPEFMAPPIRK